MLIIILLISFIPFLPICSSECVRFEFHEKIGSSFDQSDLVRAMCLGKGGKIVDYSLTIVQFSGPLIFNVTFHCCAPSPCLSDHDCPINFNCNLGLCSVAACSLTDEPEIILQEGRSCFIDDDCYFDIPFDADNWKCLPDPWCFHNKSCDTSYNFCKRCPTGYIDPDPKRFTSSDGSIQPPTTSSPWWLSPTLPPPVSSTASATPPTINSLDINRLLYPIDQPRGHHEHSVPNITESPIDFVFASTPMNRINTPSTTPDPITVGYDELSPNNDENHSNNNSGGHNLNATNATTPTPTTTTTTTTSTTTSDFGASDLPVNLSDDELISNVTYIELARIDSVDSVDEILNSTDSSTPYESPSPVGSSESVPIYDSFSSTNLESRFSPVVPFATSNPFAWPGLFDSDLNRTSTIRNNSIESSTTTIPNFTDINYI